MIYSPSAILGVYYFLLTDEYSCIKKCPGSSEFYNGSWDFEVQ